jgi:hypothetical protein
MKPLPARERRQIFLAQQTAARRMKDDLLAPPRVAVAPAPDRRAWLIVTIAAGALLGGSLLLGDVVSFHVPASFIEVLWPRM